MRRPRDGAGRRALKNGGIVDGKSDGELHVRSPRQAGVDSTPISCNLTTVAGRREDCRVYVQV